MLPDDARRVQSPSAALPRNSGLVHEAMFYRDTADYAFAITNFLREGFELAQPTLVAVPRPHVDLLRSALGSDAESVEFVDMTEAGRNPGRIIRTVLHAFVRGHPTSRVHIVDEPIWPGRSAAECRAALQHEALINIALADHEATILCPYDRHGLDAATLAQARQAHPVLIEQDRREISTDYRDPRAVADASLRALPEPPEWWGDMRVFSSLTELRALRLFVHGLASRAGLPAHRVSDLCLAVNEVATNTLEHTHASGVLSVWQDPDTDSLICEITDSGQLHDRLVGRMPPDEGDSHGRGLMLVNSLCDLVEMPTGQIGAGTTVRLHMRLR
ncbi:MAG: anti-sigma regulatory factor [Pseudonocardiales bacterium]|nr:MAG: anti-sigma regulatory factor [Pseudonocardiales bacterium]